MRILQITPEAPSNKSGGGLGVAQTILSLKQSDIIVDYVGPEILEEEYVKLYNNIFALKATTNILLRIFDVLLGHTNSRYRAWIKLRKNLDFSMYDAVVLDFTKLDYCLIKSSPMFVRVHNIEKDYSKREYLSNKNFKSYITYKLSKKRESKLVRAATKLVVLTDKDKERLCQLYGNNLDNKIRKIPVCISSKNLTGQSLFQSKIRLLITGSLWYGENYNGAIWFIENVLSRLGNEFELIIAGSKPASGLVNLVNGISNATIIANPKDMTQLFLDANIVVVPVFNGAGMKVKVAEAFSYCKPVIGTSHSFIGYNVTNKVNSYIADTADEFVESLNEYKSLTIEQKSEFEHNVLELFKNNNDLSVSAALWRNILTEEIGGAK